MFIVSAAMKTRNIQQQQQNEEKMEIMCILNESIDVLKSHLMQAPSEHTEHT